MYDDHDDEPASMGKGGRLVSLEEVERRYHVAFRHVSTPTLSVRDIEILRGIWSPSRGGPFGDPKQILIDRCNTSKDELLCGWEYDRSWAQEYPDKLPVTDRPDTSHYDALKERVMTWTMLECLKLIKLFEDFYNIDYHVISVTPDVIQTILEGAKAARAFGVERWLAPTCGSGSLCPALVPDHDDTHR